MKKILFFCLLTINLLATDRYITLNGAGNQSGSSWANADSWSSISFWGSCTGGDRIFISGGTDSVVYTTGLSVGASGTWNNHLEILPGKYSPSPSGHSGKVIIENSSGNGIYVYAEYTTREWIKIKGFTIRYSGDYGISMVCDANHIWIDSCEVYENNNDNIWINGWCVGSPDMSLSDTTDYPNDIWISRNIVWTVPYRQYEVNDPEEECIAMQINKGVRIWNNFLYMRTVQPEGLGDPRHIDCIQAATAVADMKIWNNVAIVDSNVNGHCFILGVFSQTSNLHDTLLVYNNYLYNGGTTFTGHNDRGVLLWRGSEGGQPYDPVCWGINNTIVTANRTCVNSKSDDYAARESNNIFIQMGQAGSHPPGDGELDIWGSTYGSANIKYIDSCKTNLVWRNYAPYDLGLGGNDWYGNGTPNLEPTTWASWLGYGGDGVNENPELVGNYRTGDLFGEISATSPAIDAGTDMSYVLNKFTYMTGFYADRDIFGNLRDANWDIGCFEYGAGGWSPPDTTATVTINSVTNAELGSYHIGSGILSGADSTFHIWTATADSFRVTGGSFNTTMVSAVSGNTLYIPVVASNQYSTPVTNYVVVSGTTRSFTVTTKAETPPSGESGVVYGSNGKLLYTSDGKIMRVRR
jgi:hypothetical protein